jgi:hypothetical protein
MRKSILLVSGVGIGAGLLFALKRGSNKTDQDKHGSGNGKPERSAEDSRQEANVEATAGSLRSDRKLTENGRGSHSGSSMERATHAARETEPEIDDRGTGQQEASQILKSVRDAAFDSSDEKLALALGRPTEEIEAWTSGAGTIDGDVVMKARVLAVQRGVEIQ